MSTDALQEPAFMLIVFHSALPILQSVWEVSMLLFCLLICVAHISVWDSGVLLTDVLSICRERGRSGSSSGGLGGAGGGGQSELQLQRQRVITRRKALQRKLSEVRQITALTDVALVSDADQPSTVSPMES